MLPAIRRHVHFALRGLSGEAAEDAMQEILAYAMVAYKRLWELGKAQLIYPSVLARYGAAQYRAGRRVGNEWHRNEVLAKSAQRRHGFIVERLDEQDKDTGQWKEAVVEDHRTPVPDQAAFRIDFPTWLGTLSSRDRRIAETLSVGERTKDVARRFGISSGRVSQLRRELRDCWDRFHCGGQGNVTVA